MISVDLSAVFEDLGLQLSLLQRGFRLTSGLGIVVHDHDVANDGALPA